MTIEESSIFINLKRLRRLLYIVQFSMTKADRIIYGTPLMKNCGMAIADFTLAFTVKEKRVDYLEECMGYFYVLKTDLEFCADENILKLPKRKRKMDSNGNLAKLETDDDQVNTMKIEVFGIVAKIDSDMCRWRASLSTGQDRTRH